MGKRSQAYHITVLAKGRTISALDSQTSLVEIAYEVFSSLVASRSVLHSRASYRPNHLPR
jgi:hypothetical protein